MLVCGISFFFVSVVAKTHALVERRLRCRAPQRVSLRDVLFVVDFEGAMLATLDGYVSIFS